MVGQLSYTLEFPDPKLYNILLETHIFTLHEGGLETTLQILFSVCHHWQVVDKIYIFHILFGILLFSLLYFNTVVVLKIKYKYKSGST